MPSPTIQDVCDLADETLNDEGDDSERRWPNARRLKFCQDALDAVRNLRPDLFIGQFGTFDSFSLTLVSTFPIDPSYRRVVADYIIMRCETGDDEHVNSNRVKLAYDFFKARLVLGG